MSRLVLAWRPWVCNLSSNEWSDVKNLSLHSTPYGMHAFLVEISCKKNRIFLPCMMGASTRENVLSWWRKLALLLKLWSADQKLSVIWKVIRDSESQTTPQNPWIRIYILPALSGDLWAHYCLKSTRFRNLVFLFLNSPCKTNHTTKVWADSNISKTFYVTSGIENHKSSLFLTLEQAVNMVMLTYLGMLPQC